VIDARDSRRDIDALLVSHAIPVEWLDVVEDVQAWCTENSIEDDNPFRPAKCFYTVDRCYILIAAVQTDEVIASSKDRMRRDGFGVELGLLTSDSMYLKHLVLHEIAAFKLQTSDQLARDRWAFEQLYAAAA
jgi:hypothetical protein